MDFTVKFNLLPCQHVILTLTSGIQTKQIVMTRNELKEELFDFNMEDIVKGLIVSFAKEQFALGKTLPQVKMAIETKVFKI